MDTRYLIPAVRHRVEQTIERSRFVCTLERCSTAADAQAFVREVSGEFSDATHNCWAFVAGAPGNTNQVGMSDDGEPHGTAGRPMLTVLLHSGIGEIAAVVSRYYGGTKLGTGGLVKAYGGVVKLAIEALPVTEKIDYVDVRVMIDYASVTVVQLQLDAIRAKIVAQEYGADVQYRLLVPRSEIDTFISALADLTRGAAVVELTQ